MSPIEPNRGAVERIVRSFRDATGYDAALGSFAFGDSPEMAEELARLVLDGPKRATAGWVDDEEQTPTVGQHDVVLGGDGQPVCIIRTTEVRTVAFREADPAFAWDEGEGDRTLSWWRAAHLRFYRRIAEATDRTFDDDAQVNLERFEVVWPELDPAAPLHRDGDLTVRPVRPDDRAWVRRVIGELTDEDGWLVDRLPALLARRHLTTAGVLVFRPRPRDDGPTEIVASALLDEDADVEAVLRQALGNLAREHRWGHPTG